MSTHTVQLKKTGQYLMGFDYGYKRIGMAIGQTITATAQPLATIQVTKQQPDWDPINTLIQTWQPQALVVGLPQPIDGSESILMKAIQHFCQQLQARYSLPVYTIDERLSSVAAAERLNPSQKRPKKKAKDQASFWVESKKNGELDAIAAQIILETWFAECL